MTLDSRTRQLYFANYIYRRDRWDIVHGSGEFCFFACCFFNFKSARR